MFPSNSYSVLLISLFNFEYNFLVCSNPQVIVFRSNKHTDKHNKLVFTLAFTFTFTLILCCNCCMLKFKHDAENIQLITDTTLKTKINVRENLIMYYEQIHTAQNDSENQWQ